MKNVGTNLGNFKGKVDQLDVDKLLPVPTDLNKVSDIVNYDILNKDVYNAKINKC